MLKAVSSQKWRNKTCCSFLSPLRSKCETSILGDYYAFLFPTFGVRFVANPATTIQLTRSLREPGGPCTMSMEVSESRMERVKFNSFIST